MHQTNTFLFGGNLSASAFLQAAKQNSVLGVLCFTAQADSVESIKAQTVAPVLHVPMQNLSKDEVICECWFSLSTPQQGAFADIQYQHDDDVLFGVIHLDESAFQSIENKTALQQAAESAYRQIFALIEQLNYPHLFRFWNYIADINADSNELERYRQFNLGRYEAFLAFDRAVTGNIPAACALGFNQSKQAVLSIAFMAGRVQAIAIENPRQISAYQYPEQYGPASPTFSRASLVKLRQSELLLISGTASIVGHATQHISDAVIQTREAMTNIAVVLEQANKLTKHGRFSLASLHYRAYVRHPAHVKEIHEELIRYVGAEPTVTYFHADICRKDLLLEIEATAEQACTESPLVKD